ncbi:MAG: hypothetical protein JSW28_03935 [Thermoplasmata archaeon]|nr:MAG: hypothetical protein JSW28_03935 [Thermoplasmata archaeon]
MPDENLKLTIGLDRLIYKPHERILCTVILTNTGSKPVPVNKRLLVNTPHAPEPFREVTFEILSPSKEILNFRTRINVGPPNEDDIAELGPSESVEHVYDAAHDFLFEEKGEYTIRAVYENRFDFEGKGEVWKGRLESNILTFRLE